MSDFSGFTPRETPELPDDPNAGDLVIGGDFLVTGNIGIGTTIPTSTLHVIGNSLITGITTVGLGATSSPSNSQLTFELTSNTNLRIKVRGTDGVIRSADVTLS